MQPFLRRNRTYANGQVRKAYKQFTSTEPTRSDTMLSEVEDVKAPEGPGTGGNKPLMRNRQAETMASRDRYADGITPSRMASKTQVEESMSKAAKGPHPAEFNKGKQMNYITMLAKHMYSAYCLSVGGVAFNGDPLPDWDTFAADPNKEKQRDAWIAAANAARNWISGPQ